MLPIRSIQSINNNESDEKQNYKQCFKNKYILHQLNDKSYIKDIKDIKSLHVC